MNDEIDDYSRQMRERALRIMRNDEIEVSSPRLWQLALGLQAAVRIDPDPDYFERIFDLRRNFEADVRYRTADVLSASPSPSPQFAEEIRRQADDYLASVSWEKKPHLGACFSVVPDRLQDLGLTANRLSILTGATKRLGFEGRLDERAVLGFLHSLTDEARKGLALLDSLEKLVAKFAHSEGAKFDARSRLPDIIYAFLVFPALDTIWLATALDMDLRVVQKSIKRLVDAGLITAWAERHQSTIFYGSREVKLWTASTFQMEFERSFSRGAATLPIGRVFSIPPAEILDRHLDENVSVPMSVVYQRFDKAMIDIDREFGHLFGAISGKKSSSRKPVESNLNV